MTGRNLKSKANGRWAKRRPAANRVSNAIRGFIVTLLLAASPLSVTGAIGLIALFGRSILNAAVGAGAPLWLGVALFASACVGITTLASPEAPSRDLAGVWVDSAKATADDTVAWRLDRNGADWTLRIRVVRDGANRVTTEQHETRYGYWYLEGSLADTAQRALCFKKRPRDGGTCYPFHLDTLAGGGGGAPARRQIVIAGYRGQQRTRTRVLIERLP